MQTKDKKKTLENRMSGESYVKKSVIFKPQFFFKTYIQCELIKSGKDC